MKRIVLTLTDAEHADLEQYAARERRTVRDMAAYLVAKHTPKPPQATIVVNPPNYINSYRQSCVACALPASGVPHTCLTTSTGSLVVSGNTTLPN